MADERDIETGNAARSLDALTSSLPRHDAASAVSTRVPTSGGSDSSDLASGESSFLRALAQDSAPGEASPADRIGVQLGRYLIRERLGAGGMGVVYRADDVQLVRPVALKVVRKRGEPGSDQMRRFIREARAASAVRHPNVAAVYEVGEHDGEAFIAMELVPGVSLRSRLRAGPFEIGEALRVTREIAKALGAAHAAGVVHRDLKPDNVILEPSGGVKVLDFGLARWTPPAGDDPVSESLTEEGAIMGTPGYMSPEQVRGLKVDARSDFFALGVVLFELLNGARPFTGATKMDVLVATSRDAAPPVSRRVPRDIQELVASLLAKQPEARPRSTEAILLALDGRSSAGVQVTWRAAALGTLAAVAVAALGSVLAGGESPQSPAREQLSASATYDVSPAPDTSARRTSRTPIPAAAEQPAASAQSASTYRTVVPDTPAVPRVNVLPRRAAASPTSEPKPKAAPPKASAASWKDEVWTER